MKDCNKKIYEKIREYLDNCLDTYVEIVIEYKDGTFGNLHQIVQYNRTASNTWLGVIGNMFDFDFFDCKEVVSFVPFRNLTPTENTVVDIDDDVNIKWSNMMDYIDTLEPYSPNTKYISNIPTKTGWHLITTPFNLQQFRKEYPDIDVHKNNPTLLYCL